MNAEGREGGRITHQEGIRMQVAQVSYVGFKNLATSREYAFRVTQVDGSSNDFLFAVSNDAFLTHHVRYQDAAEICFLKLQRAVIASGPGLPAARQDVTEQDFEAYRLAHLGRTTGRRL
jgi:hypothetical protein